MSVRYRAAVARGLLGLGGLTVVLIAWAVLLGAYTALSGLLATAMLLFLAQRARGEYLRYHPRVNAIVVGERRYPDDRHGKLIAHRGRLYVIRPGAPRRRVPVSGRLADPGDWRTLLERVGP
ncbi:hypothetical protein Afil01_50620 [Actinorhabdospora filicis]|uniref:Uncharacterized protein n=1 Tax=Actinorhabdospora filicis TaxID=1785913 RepID=A0A9W6WCX4_9ACTN|nr:hypothetical protein [Actinorhabdospora filicis]GLZ80255.1 hypothetical protein Afil01_50620 [Actinorhabdospora filicis]